MGQEMTKALAPQQKSYLAIRDLLRGREKEICAQVIEGNDARRLLDLALSVVWRDEKLVLCTPESILRSVITCARLGLEPTGRTGGMYLIPFKRNFKVGNKWETELECTPVTDYRGEITLCIRSGFAEDIKPVIVYEKDRFRVWEGTRQEIEHEPAEDDRGAERLVYAVALLSSGRYTFEVLDKREIERRRSFSKMKDAGAWKDHYWRMALKSGVRAIANRLAKSSVPKDRKLARAYSEHVQREEATEFGFDEAVLEVDVETPPASATDALATKLERKASVDDAEDKYRAENKRMGRSAIDDEADRFERETGGST